MVLHGSHQYTPVMLAYQHHGSVMGYKPPMNWRRISQPSTGKSMGESHLVPITYSTKLLLKKAACMMFCGHFNLMWVHIRNMTIKKKCESSPLSDHFRSLFFLFFVLYLSLLASSLCFGMWVSNIFSALNSLPSVHLALQISHDGSMYAIYGIMDPINIPQMLAYIPAPWIRHGIWKLFKTSNTIHTWDMLGSS